MISPHGTQISKDDIPHGTQDIPHGTHDIPHGTEHPHGTDHPPRYCTHIIQGEIVYAISCQASGKTINSIELLKVMDVWLCRPLVNMSVICEFAKKVALVNATQRMQRKFPIIYKFSPESRITRICSKFSGI